MSQELRVVNERLWEVENEIRALERAADFGPRFIELARSVYAVNDRRASIKRKINRVVVKSRARVPRDKWREELIMDPHRILDINFHSSREEYAFLEFVRLARQIGARPVVLIRYTRESYISRVDEYARVTFDRKLLYQPTEKWDCWGDEGNWRPMDSAMMEYASLPRGRTITS